MNQFDEGANILVRAYVAVPGSGNALAVSDVDTLLGVDLGVFDGDLTMYRLEGIAAASVINPAGTFGWTYDSRGYNFSYTIPAGAFTDIGGKDYRIEFTIHTNSYGAIAVDCVAACRGRRSA